MTYDPEKHRRRSIRLKDYDYSQAGAYFITICTQHRICLFGDVAEDVFLPNGAGRMLTTVWRSIPQRFPDVELDAFVVMPNHIHGIILLPDFGGAPPLGAPPVGVRSTDKPATTRVAPMLGRVVGAFKSLTTVEYARCVKTDGWSAFRDRLWQRNYYEHVIRDEQALNRRRSYIEENPLRWSTDEENPDRQTS